MSRHHNPTSTHPHREPIPPKLLPGDEGEPPHPWAKTFGEVKRSARRLALYMLALLAVAVVIYLTRGDPRQGSICVLGPRNNLECAPARY